MALTRRMLKEFGIDEGKVEEIIEAHVETVEALKKERDAAIKAADDADRLREQLKAAQDALEATKTDGWQARYEELQQEYEGFKAQIEAEKQQAEKVRLYSEVLREAGVDEKRIQSVLRVSKLDDVRVQNGSIDGRDELIKKLRDEWADFIPQTSTHGADVPDPPKTHATGFDTMPLMEKMRYANEHPNDPEVGAWLGRQQ